MDRRWIEFGGGALELCTEGTTFLGIGKVRIGQTLVRSGRLPWRPETQTFDGLQLGRLLFRDVQQQGGETRVRLLTTFRPAFTKVMLDHSTDPIHDTTDWDGDATAPAGELDMVFTSATDEFEGVAFQGFAFHYEYASETVPLFFIYDRSSWELDGDITGATAYSQSSCSAPVATFAPDTAWTTEGLVPVDTSQGKANPVMTHNLPRWASHQAFDYQFKNDRTLIGVWERVDLIRSVLRRDAGKPEFKTFDKYIFDEALRHATPAKKILLSSQPRSAVDQQNLWTWIFDEVHRRAREEYGIREEPVLPKLGWNYWSGFTMDTYYRDLLPAAAAIGAKALFIDNLNKSDASEKMGTGNMCCSHEFEVAPSLGGVTGLKRFKEECTRLDILPFSWTNPNQGAASPRFMKFNTALDTLVRLADTRNPYFGAYIPWGGPLNLNSTEAREFWTAPLKKTKVETGHCTFLWDSFYNSAFMTVSFAHCKPRTTWRAVLSALKEMQDAGFHFMIESFGPWGEVQHGCPTSYNLDALFACYKIGLGSGYTTVPSAGHQPRSAPWPAAQLHRILGHMTNTGFSLFYEGQRIDALFTPEQKRVLADYYANQPHMHKRYLQEDGQSVIWHNREKTRATIWNFADRTVKLPGAVRDLSEGRDLPRAESYHLKATHTYAFTGGELPVTLGCDSSGSSGTSKDHRERPSLQTSHST